MSVRPVLLITGATGGIGLALARQYAETHVLILVGRRPHAEVRADLPPDAVYVQADLSAPTLAAEQIVSALDTHGVHTLDRVILNAGTASWGAPATESAAAVRRILDVNLTAPLALAHACAPRLFAAGGTLVLVGSVVAAIACPAYATYGASKAALDGFARSLSVEWRGRVPVMCIHPGATNTGIHAKAGIEQADMDWTQFPSAERVAASIYRRVEGAKRRRTVVGLGNALVFRAGRRFARPIDALMRRSRR